MTPSSPDELRTTTGGGDSLPTAHLANRCDMNNLDPSVTSTCGWYADCITNSLAAAIADAAINDPTAIPDRLLAAYYDAVQLKATVQQLNKETTAAAMQEVSA